jgi:hypothetical protein
VWQAGPAPSFRIIVDLFRLNQVALPHCITVYLYFPVYFREKDNRSVPLQCTDKLLEPGLCLYVGMSTSCSGQKTLERLYRVGCRPSGLG